LGLVVLAPPRPSPENMLLSLTALLSSRTMTRVSPAHYAEAVSDWRNSSLLMHDLTGVFVHNIDFSGVRRMVDGINQDDYLVIVFNSSSEGSVALITCAAGEKILDKREA